MEALVIDPARLISDIVGYVSELRTTYQSSQQPLTDDETTLHKFCVKLETVLRHEQKEKYTVLGVRKDYWNFIQECISKDDGVKHVQVLPQVRTSQGKGRAFIRYSLVKNSLADAIQRCLVQKKHLSAWYRSDAILCHPSLSTALINKLYDLNGIEFDLPCAGNELDISWPAFSRRGFVNGQSSVLGRRSSISSMTSADFRNDRPDPLLGLASEVSSLKAVFPEERFCDKVDDDTEMFDEVSIPDSTVETPNVTEITLDISHLHQRILCWKADLESQLTKATMEVKKAHDERKFAVQEYELKLKQLNERYSNLTRSAADNSNAKVKELCARLTTAEEALSEREAEIQQLRREVRLAVSSSEDAQRSIIDLERQLAVSERHQRELSDECEQLGEKLKDKEYIADELKSNLSKQNEKCNQLELLNTESSRKNAEVEGELKAKSVALERIQESFEKVNGMVFGSFEELELELKARLIDTERDLESQREENRRLTRNVVDVDEQSRDLAWKCTEATDKVEELENKNSNLQITIGDLETQLSVLKQEYNAFVSNLFETLPPEEGHDEGDGDAVGKETSRVVSKVKHLVVEVSSLHQQIKEKSSQEEQLTEHLEELEASIVKKDLEMKALIEEVDSSKKRVEFINKEKKLLEKGKLEADYKLVALEKSEQTLKSDFSLAVQEKCKALDELSYLREQSLLKTGVDEELYALRQQLDETVQSKEKLSTDLNSISGVLEIIESEKKSLDEQLKALKESMAACQDDKVSLEHELNVTKQQLEVANEARIRAEQGQVKTHEQLEGLRCMMDQEIAALKFQLGSEAIKYQTELKVLSDQTQEYTSVKDRLSELQELVVDLEARLKERNDVIQHDKQKYVSEIKHLRNEVQQYKSGFDGNKLKIRALENELLLTTKQLEEERSKQKDLKRWAEEIDMEKSLANQQCEDKIAELQADIEEFKERLIQVTREKADLWAKAHDMEHQIKIKSDDRWMDDSEVTHCLECKTEFSFLLRKHHCRVCGRILCNDCSNNWVQTPHSRKLRRVCNRCLSVDKRLLLQLVGSARETEDDAKSDINRDSLQRSESLLSAGEGSERETLGIEEDTRTDGFPPPPQQAPSTSTTGQPKTRKSSSTSTRSLDKQEKSEQERSQSVASSNSGKYTSLKTVKNPKRKTTKSFEEPPWSKSPEECDYEFLDPEEEETDEQPEARVVISDSDNKADLVIPTVNQEPGEFWHVTIPPGRRHVFQVLVATPRASLYWMFTSEKKSILFGVAYKLTETKKDQESETVVPLTRSDSHLHSVKGHLDNVSAGIYLLVFDNTFSRLTSKRLFCMVRVQRREDDEEQDSFT